MSTTTLIQIASGAYQSLSSKEGFDLALVLATFEQAVDLHFTGAGLSILKENQVPSSTHGKQLFKILDGLEFYDIDKVLVCESELLEFTQPNNLWQNIQVLDDDAWQKKLQTYQHILRF